jgi:hypothetical protein
MFMSKVAGAKTMGSNSLHTEPRVTADAVTAAIERGRYLRSQAFRSMLQSIFGRPEEREAAEAHEEHAHATGSGQVIALAGRC